MTKADQTHRNTRNQHGGATFQKQLDRYHATLLGQGAARVYRTAPETRQTGPHSAVIVGKGPVDYIAFCANGHAIHFDAKSRAGDDFYTADEGQVQWLRQMATWGFTAGWMVHWHDHDEVRWHPISTIGKRVFRRDGILVPHGYWFEIVY